MAKTAQPKADRRKPATRRKVALDSAAVESAISEDAIAARAFEYYCSRGGEHGRDIDDWLAAERELRAGA